MKTAVLLVAAGRGTRAGAGQPKQWRALAGKRVFDWSYAAFSQNPHIAHILTVIHPDDTAHLPAGVEFVHGGTTRTASVRAGLEALETEGFSHVLIHDAARACVSPEVISGVIEALKNKDAAAPALPVTDALWHGDNECVTGTHSREGLYRAQTPQGFSLPAILAAHRAHKGEALDDVEIARAAGLDVSITLGDEDNLKLTHAGDFARAERILRGSMDIRLGNGFDVHAFTAGDHVVLCGVNIPHSKALLGHSDADVGMHAITDALYGAMAEGDIGRHFPPSDPQWKGAASHIFLEHACALARSMGYTISNIDCTLVCEQPKIGPHASAMQTELSRIMGIEPSRISVKATTSERLGFTGREEGIAALATATLVKT
ncbi:bifunctional 2-C-methyl-D-erythritol 4-phosphate cytidylyltransferase/2-C-methyl-D-erythritol 2,4-cyclodiphosphate synthase [Lentibacter sp. XHP0401]|uniref:bifunctional 2-C-methyl-D-erythritol 4-phosphate cytidylyltransferase/2-C-methyl-D-erythritol 2,4-cyclodiphosphate synthase n=1 Tax=Lentibacter sp. XHP0401 TaxID=2984334 RepID=UPI0021E71667|nr:bifunctional 2-C-methyl-D-erythritol 4-phosphate cytidylyltransferase/2-C-methyl-D-erythritol 2,4-cyclodiphosphate synthase [Lentibacter sp. XHP0401]MCV2892331.1 bifunctional 2-C-methyl-D-erythritol 4-phosphate cytidylyltransferase/2-C-methyl-D-erythritol 2,4-cyclodiphosphate synthase [Lentibacter sp. XHP0401]